MTPKEFAKMCRDTEAVREASFNNETGRYMISYSAAADKACPAEWAMIVGVLLFPGYADVWEWCDGTRLWSPNGRRTTMSPPREAGKPPKYTFAVFDWASARCTMHHCDGGYDDWEHVIMALKEAERDPNVGKVLISW